MWRLLHHYAHAVELRSHLSNELQRARRRGHRLPPNIFWKVWKSPSQFDDQILLLRFLKADDSLLLIDAGGNVGYWSEQFLMFFPKTRILAFEPVQKSFAVYQDRFRGRD